MLSTQDPDEIIQTVMAIAPTFGAINLEDIAAPQCFYIEEELNKRLPIPVFHDDQHGTAIVALAALLNAVPLVEKDIPAMKIVIAGTGAAGIAIANILRAAGFSNIIMTDSKGIVVSSRTDLNEYKHRVSLYNQEQKVGTLADALVGADVFIGVSQPNIATRADIASMNEKPIVFALANPNPEITRDEAIEGGAFIYASGRSDVPNQINNLLAFPGVLRGALDARIQDITMEHKLAAARALAAYVTSPERDRLLPNPLDKGVPAVIAEAVKTVNSK